MQATIRQCAVLVGGLGTRLGELTATTPKPMLPCGDRPFLAWLLLELIRFGVEDVVLLTGYRSEAVQAVLAESAFIGFHQRRRRRLHLAWPPGADAPSWR